MILSRNNQKTFYYLGFLIWPFGITIAALKYRHNSWSKNIFWLFCIFFGYIFILPEEGPDSVRYAQRFLEYSNFDLSLAELWNSFYSSSTNYLDILEPLITFLVSRVWNNLSFLFLVYGLIFGYFFSRNLWFIFNKIESNITIALSLYILSIALFNPIWNINGFRMYTAAQIFVYGTLPLITDGNIKRIWWSAISVFMHFSFIFPFLVLLLFLLLKNKLNLYFTFFIISSFIKELDLEWLSNSLLFLPEIFQPRITSYLNPMYAESMRFMHQSLNWYIPFSDVCIKWIIYGYVIFMYLFHKKTIINHSFLERLFCFSLLLYGMSNIAGLIPAGVRFMTISNIFMFTTIALFLSSNPDIKGLTFLNRLSLPALVFYCIVAIRVGMDYFGGLFFYGNPLAASILTDHYPLINYIKGFFLK
ncbi:MAG TPA: hypothetical protein VHI78_10280 [Bacteroidales bacterium]|nr:hypothetical protein [Bacteroidales bacterium]